MYSKEEKKELKLNFWKGFKRYCSKNKIDRRWVLTGVKIKSTQLKFYADNSKALVMFQIDHKNVFRRYHIYESFLSYQQLIKQEYGEDIQWNEDLEDIDGRTISAIYFELPKVNIYNTGDWEKIYRFFAEKMISLEEIYWEYRDLINERIKMEE